MSKTYIPVTDAFDDTDPLQSLEVELTSRQVDWLEQRADERGLSVDHVLRSILMAQIRGMDSDSAPLSRSGDGVPRSSDVDTTPDADRNAATDGAETVAEEGNSASVVDSLRSASERLQDLTDDDNESEPSSDLRDTLARVQAYADTPPEDASSDEEDASSTEEAPDITVDDRSRSMFDMVEDDG